MLVLTRKPGQGIEIARCISIVVTRVTAGRVVISIDAPRDIQIRRSELEPPHQLERHLTAVR